MQVPGQPSTILPAAAGQPAPMMPVQFGSQGSTQQYASTLPLSASLSQLQMLSGQSQLYPPQQVKI